MENLDSIQETHPASHSFAYILHFSRIRFNMEARAWTFSDLKESYALCEQYKDTEDPIKHYLYGVTLEMAGQGEEADDKYSIFRASAIMKYGNLEDAVKHYEVEAGRCGDDDPMKEHAMHMVYILQKKADKGSAHARQRSPSKACAVQ